VHNKAAVVCKDGGHKNEGTTRQVQENNRTQEKKLLLAKKQEHNKVAIPIDVQTAINERKGMLPTTRNVCHIKSCRHMCRRIRLFQ